MDPFNAIPETALAWHRAGRGAVLATVTGTWGSAPRRVGSQLAISGDGEITGSVSGGCVEGAVITEVLEALQDGQSRQLEFGVSDEDAFSVGLACGGTITVMVDPVGPVLTEALLDQLCTARAARQPVAYIADLKENTRQIARDGFETRLRMDRSGFEEDGRFVAIHNPPLRLLVVGAVHIAQALLPMARIAGYDPVVIDPREAFASPARFPETELCHDCPDEAVAALGLLDRRTALVLLTHDPRLDDPALEQALRSECFYIGALGSARTHGKRVDRLTQAGFSEPEIARIHSPIGLKIGAAGPAEIAASILAEMTRMLRTGT